MAFDEITRPNECINRLYQTLSFHVKTYSLVATTREGYRLDSGNNELFLINNGTVKVFRKHDNLKYWDASSPLIIGLVELFYPSGKSYYRISSDASVSALSSELASEVFEQENLWRDVAEVIAYYCQIMLYRDNHLVSKSSYIAIRAKLIEYLSRQVGK